MNPDSVNDNLPLVTRELTSDEKRMFVPKTDVNGNFQHDNVTLNINGTFNFVDLGEQPISDGSFHVSVQDPATDIEIAKTYIKIS